MIIPPFLLDEIKPVEHQIPDKIRMFHLKNTLLISLYHHIAPQACHRTITGCTLYYSTIIEYELVEPFLSIKRKILSAS